MTDEKTPINLADHVGHAIQMTETASTIWYIEIEGNEVRAYDYTTSDGEGDYVIECPSCMASGPLPDTAKLSFG